MRFKVIAYSVCDGVCEGCPIAESECSDEHAVVIKCLEYTRIGYYINVEQLY